jgi:NADH-quinone oxidoreductase subunit L
MTAPLMVLAVFAALIGLIGTPWANGFAALLQRAPGATAAPHHVNVPFMLGALLLSLIGIAGGWAVYGRAALTASSVDPLAGRLGGLWRALERRWFVDELYAATVVRLVRIAARVADLMDAMLSFLVKGVSLTAGGGAVVASFVDDNVVRRLARGLAGGTALLGRALSFLQSGRVQAGLTAVAFGVAAFGGLLLWWSLR